MGNGENVLGSDNRLSTIIKERERLKNRLREAKKDMLEKTLGEYLNVTNHVREEIAGLDKRMLDESMNYGQMVIPGC